MDDRIDSKLPAKLRWITASTGLVTLSSAAITLIYLPAPILLIMGSVIAGRSPRAGRCLMYAGASLLSVYLLPVYVLLLPEFYRHLSYTDLLGFFIDAGWIGSLVLPPICDVMLVMDGYKRRESTTQ
jgi:hypothetical protein